MTSSDRPDRRAGRATGPAAARQSARGSAGRLLGLPLLRADRPARVRPGPGLPRRRWCSPPAGACCSWCSSRGRSPPSWCGRARAPRPSARWPSPAWPWRWRLRSAGRRGTSWSRGGAARDARPSWSPSVRRPGLRAQAARRTPWAPRPARGPRRRPRLRLRLDRSPYDGQRHPDRRHLGAGPLAGAGRVPARCPRRRGARGGPTGRLAARRPGRWRSRRPGSARSAGSSRTWSGRPAGGGRRSC